MSECITSTNPFEGDSLLKNLTDHRRVALSEEFKVTCPVLVFIAHQIEKPLHSHPWCMICNITRNAPPLNWVCSISGGNLVDHRKQEQIVIFGDGFPPAKHNLTPSFKWDCPPRWNTPHALNEDDRLVGYLL